MKLFLAPLAEYTDAPFRLMCAEGGADLAYTEMVSAAALFHGSSPTRQLMETVRGEGPVACQLFGSETDEVAFAAREAAALRTDGAPRFCELNLNAGCPMPRIIRSGCGAKLVTDPERVYRLLKAMADAAPDTPVTLKTRLGPRPGEDTIFELLDAAERAGAKGIAVHARYTSQMHGGPVNLDLLAEVVARAKIPVVGNGGVRTAADAKAMFKTGVAAVMIGRGALAEPSIFARLKAELRGEEPPAPPWSVPPVALHLERLLEFRRFLAERYPDDHVPSEDAMASVKMHKHLFHYFKGRPGAGALRKRLSSIRTLAEVREAIASALTESEKPVDVAR